MVDKIILPREIKLSKKKKRARGGLVAAWDALSSEQNYISNLIFKLYYESEPGAEETSEPKKLNLQNRKMLERMQKISAEIKVLEESSSERHGGGKRGNPLVRVRDLFIRELGDQTDLEICKELDEMVPRDGWPIGFVANWPDKYEVKTYEEAYNHAKCKKLVEVMISKARKAY